MPLLHRSLLFVIVRWPEVACSGGVGLFQNVTVVFIVPESVEDLIVSAFSRRTRVHGTVCGHGVVSRSVNDRPFTLLFFVMFLLVPLDSVTACRDSVP